MMSDVLKQVPVESQSLLIIFVFYNKIFCTIGAEQQSCALCKVGATVLRLRSGSEGCEEYYCEHPCGLYL